MPEVLIKGAFPPDQGKKMGKINIAHNGQDLRLVAWPDKIDQIRSMVGQMVDLEWEQESFQARDGRTVTSLKLKSIGASKGAAPAANVRPSAQAKEIFVTGVVGRAAGSGVIKSPGDILTWTANARVAWETVMEAEEVSVKTKPEPTREELDDLIPF